MVVSSKKLALMKAKSWTTEKAQNWIHNNSAENFSFYETTQTFFQSFRMNFWWQCSTACRPLICTQPQNLCQRWWWRRLQSILTHFDHLLVNERERDRERERGVYEGRHVRKRERDRSNVKKRANCPRLKRFRSSSSHFNVKCFTFIYFSFLSWAGRRSGKRQRVHADIDAALTGEPRLGKAHLKWF